MKTKTEDLKLKNEDPKSRPRTKQNVKLSDAKRREIFLLKQTNFLCKSPLGNRPSAKPDLVSYFFLLVPGSF